MPGVIDTLRIVYEVDVADKGTRHLLASERRVQKSVVQTSRALAQQDAAARRSGATATSTAARKASAHTRAARATRHAATETTRLTRAERAAATEASRSAAATRRAARANDDLAVSARRAQAAETRRRRAAPAGPGVVTRAAGRVRGAGAGLLAGFGAVSAVRLMAAEYTEAARLQKVIAQGIKSTGGAANVTAGHVERMSAAMGRQAGVDDELIGKGASVILTFTKVRNEVGKGNQIFDRANQAALDLSVRLGKDLTGTSLQVGKALNDPIKGVTALSRAGVQFTAQQREQIKTMVESGNTLGAQRMILKELETQVGGTARANAQPVDRLRASVNDLAEAAGTALAPAVEKAAGSTADFINEMVSGTGGGGRFAAQMKDVAGDLKPVGQGLLSVGKFLAQHPRLVMGAVGAYAAFRTVKFGAGVVRQLRDIRTAAAESNIASRVADGARGTGRLVKRALGGVKGVIKNLMSSAGRSGGAAAAESAASSAGANMGPALDRHQKGITGGRSGGRWSKLGRIAGGAMGVALIAGLAIAYRKEIGGFWNKVKNDILGRAQRDRQTLDVSPERRRQSGLYSTGTRGPARRGAGARRGGIVGRFRSGGLVPIVASGGEVLVDGDRAAMIPGPSDRDATPLLARPGAAVLTADGQARMAMGASLAEAVRSQAPHFAKGGVVPGKYTATSYGPPWGGIQGTGVTKTGVNLKSGPRVYGIAVDPRMIPLGSKVYAHPNPFGYTGRFSAFDTGGAIKGRRIDFYDWRGRRRQLAWGRRTVTVSRARIARRQEGEDTYRAPGGGGAETTVAMLGRARRRAGLLDDAFAQGRAAGREGLTPRVIREEGNPVLKAIIDAINGAGTQPDKGGTARRFRPDAVPTLSDRGGGRGGFPAGSRIARMSAKASAIDAKRYQYAWGGGHGRIGVPTVGSRTPRGGKRGLGYDCSGAVSAVLGAGGLLKSPLTSGGLMSWGKPGSGKRLTVRTDPGHVIMRIGRRWWGTGESNPQGGAGWLPRNTMGGRGVVRTWPGFQRGGVIGRLTPGRHVGARGAAPAGPGRALTTGLARAMTLAGGSYEALNNTIIRSLEAQLLALRAQLQRRVNRRGPAKVIRRLQGVIDMIDHELGRRVGRIEDVIEQRNTRLERGRGAAERAMRAQGVDADSSQGLGVMRTLQAAETRVRQQNVVSLQRALQTATRARNRQAVREITQALHEAQDALAESIVRQIELWRDQIRALGSEAVGHGQFVLGLTQTGAASIEAQQRLARTQDTPAAMRERAAFLQTNVVAALEGARVAHEYNAQMLAGIGDVNGWRQAVQDAASAAVDLANAQADAADLMREAAARAAQDVVDAATHSRTMGDLGLQRLELEQRLIGTFDSAGGAQGRADFIRRQILPAIHQELAALVAQQTAAQQAGDMALANQIAEAIHGKQNEVLQAQLDAQQQIAENTDPLKEFGGSVAFSFQGQLFTDLDVIRARAGA